MNPELKSLVKDFDSGNFYLDQFLKSEKAMDDSLGKTYVFLTDVGDKVIGYYNIGMGSVEQIKGTYRKKLGGAVHINCFAIDKAYQDQIAFIDTEVGKIHLSDLLLHDCMKRIMVLRSHCIGMAFVTLNSTEEGKWLYRRNEYEYLDEDLDFSKEENDVQCTQMYLPLDLE